MRGSLVVVALAAAAAAAVAAADDGDPPPAAATITAWTGLTFDAGVAALPPRAPLMVLFFAHWCGACARFGPHYEAAAASLAAADSGVAVARVDCADEGALCTRFGVRSYPTVRFGPAAAFGDAKRHRELATYGGAHEGGAVAAWATEQAASVGGGGDGAAVTAATATAAASSMDTGDVHKATLMAFRYALDGGAAALGAPGARAALRSFAALAARAHPLAACRAGAGTFVATLDRDWPAAPDAGGAPPPDAAVAALRAVALCGAAPPPPAWGACAPSVAGSAARGYTCGLWTLLHALAAGAGDGPRDGAEWLAAARGWVAHFFGCADCAAHFGAMAATPAAAAVASGRDGRLWAWRAHNEVNARVRAAEAAAGGAGGDAAHPKVQWPPRSLCAACSAPAAGVGGAPQWDEAAVDAFLLRFYGGDPADRAARAAVAASDGRGAAPAPPLGRRGLNRGDTKRAAGSPWVGVAVFGVVAAGAVVGLRAGGRRSKQKR